MQPSPKLPTTNTKTTHSHKKPKHKHPTSSPTTTPQPTTTTPTAAPNITFQPNTAVKGLKFGGQFIVKSFTVRRCRPQELSTLLNLTPPKPLPSTIAFLPSNFTILAHHAWHTLTLGLGTKKSKVIIFVFDTVAAKTSHPDLTWPHEIPLGDVNKRLIRGSHGWDFARFKFRKGCITFYVFAVRKQQTNNNEYNRRGGFECGDDLRCILHSVVALNDFLDHTAMLALPNQRSISCSSTHNTSASSHSVAAH